jgi:phage terminase large subunit
MLNASPVWHANFTATEDIIINQGGTDSGKTYAIMQLLLYYAATQEIPPKDAIITIVAESVPNLKKGAYRAAESIIGSTEFIKQEITSWNKTDREITFKKGWKMEFTSAIDEQSAKQGKRHYLFFNEANGISWLIFWQMAKRTRGQTFIDYNPSAPFWVHEKLIGTTPDGNDLHATVKLLISDHRHNPFLTNEEHVKTESIRDKNLWRVYARGLTGNLSGLIFPTWKQIPDDQFPNIDFFGGLDFGYTNDPTVLVKMAVVGNSLFVHECCYETALTEHRINEIAKANGFKSDNHIYCEQDKEFIAALRRIGCPCMPALKGPGSIKAGILKVNEFNVFYTASSKNIHEERIRYMWEKDKITGASTNTPVGGMDHSLDAIRYGCYTKYFRKPK